MIFERMNKLGEYEIHYCKQIMFFWRHVTFVYKSESKNGNDKIKIVFNVDLKIKIIDIVENYRNYRKNNNVFKLLKVKISCLSEKCWRHAIFDFNGES